MKTKSLLCAALLIGGISTSILADIGPGPAIKLPPGVVWGDLSPDAQVCLLECHAQYLRDLRGCGWPGLFCRHRLRSEYHACIGNCLHDLG
ncbi:MAG: hypothetical protein AB1347_08495 [Acidobacteriota bacterium]